MSRSTGVTIKCSEQHVFGLSDPSIIHSILGTSLEISSSITPILIYTWSFASLLNAYKAGQHLEPQYVEKAKKYIFYKKTTQPIHVYSEKEFELCLDGEMLPGTNFYVSIVPKAVNFIIPKD